MIFIVCLLIYIAAMMSVYAYDAYKGFSIDFNGNEYPPLFLVALLWPLALPLIMGMAYIEFVSKVKEKRIKEQSRIKLEKIRIEKELLEIEKEVESYINSSEGFKSKERK